MAIAGSLTYDTKIDKKGFEKGLNSIESSAKSGGTKIKNIIAGLGITKLIGTAISTINNSLDGAISRIDTLNNFPKVMSNLEIGTEESSKAINKLSDGLKGLPTTLDAGALSVQRFTSKNGDVNKSVDLFLALNDAILAGGASSEIQASAIEQISQSYAKGKPDMVEWRSLQTAMPAQIKQIAKAMLGNKEALEKYMESAKKYADANPLSSTAKELIEQLKDVENGSGDMATALGTALRTGVISMDDFMNTIVELDKNGGDGIKSFAEQAKNATGGIQTSITNAKTAIVRGVGNIISAIDNALKQTELKGIGNVISKIGTNAEKMLKKIAENINKINLNKTVNVLKNTWLWINKNEIAIKSTLGIILSVIAAMKAYKGIILLIKGINMTKNIIGTASAFLSLIPTIKSAKDAMLLLNMTFSANPIGLVISAIVALLGIVSTGIVAINKQKESFEGMNGEIKKQVNSWEELKKARNESLESSSLEIATTQKLADELQQMTDENGRVKNGYENRAKYILGELNTALGTEYTMNGNIIQQYKELKENIEQLIAKKKSEAMLEAYKSEYQTALKNKTEAVKSLADNTREYNKQLQISDDKTRTFAERSQAKGEVERIGNEIKKQTELISEYGYTVEQYEKLTTASVSGSAEEIEKAVSNMGVSYEQAKQKTNDSLASQVQAQSNYVNLIEQNLQKAKENNDEYSQIILKSELDTQKEQLKNLTQSFGERTSTIERLSSEEATAWILLARNNKEEYLRELDELPDGTRKKVENVVEHVAANEIVMKGFSALGQNATAELWKNLKTQETFVDKIEQAGGSIQKDEKIKNASVILAQKANDGFNQNVDGKKWGTDLSSNISSGMTSKNSENGIKGAASKVAGWISAFIHHSVPDEGPLKDELTYMPDMIDNLVMGINKNKYKIIRATNEMAEGMKNGFDFDNMNNQIIAEMNRAVAVETGALSANATVKANNSIFSVVNAEISIDGKVDIDGNRAGRLLAPAVCKTIKVGGLT